MRPINFAELQRLIEERKAELGLADLDDALLRNSGVRRTAEKRASLARIAARCAAAGITPLKANY